MLVELCDVGGKRDGVGAAAWNAVPLEGGGWVEGYPRQIYHSNTAKRQSSVKATVPFMQGSVCRVGTASFVVLVCLSGET